MLCCRESRQQVIPPSEVAIHHNFYDCVSFVTLRQELFMVQRNLEIYLQMRSKEAYNNFYLTPKELDKHIELLKSRKNQVVERIR